MASTNEERKKNSVLEYPKRIAKSIAFGAIDAVADEFPILSNLVKSNREAAKEVYDDVFNMNRNIKKLKSLQDKLIFKPANVAMQNFKESIASGEFYSTTRKEAMDNFAMGLMMESMMADEMDEDTMAMLNGEEVLGQDPNGTGQPDVKIKGIPEVTKGDTIIASVLSKEMRTGTNCLAKAVSVTTDAHIQTVRTIGNLLLEQNQQHSHTVKAGLNEIINGINGITQFNENILLQHAKNSLKFYDTMAQLTQENNAILKEMVEMQRNLYSGQLGQQQNPEDGQGPAAVFANGGFNLKDYVKVVTQNINEKTFLGPALQMISMAPMLIADAVANPLHFLTKQGMKTILGPQLRLAMNDLDASIMNYIRIGLAKLSRFGKTNKSGSIIGQIFGYEPKRKHLSTIDTSKLGKNARQWDMDDHLALTKAIPMFLSNIESALTGNKARYFDFTTKKFESIRKVEQAQNNRAVQDAKIAGGQAQAMIEQTLSTLFKPKNNEELVMRNKALTEFFTGMAKANGFDRQDIEKHPEKYGGAAIADIVLRIADSNKEIGRELMGTHAKLLEMAEARANAIKSGNLTDALSDAELTYAMGGHRTKNQFSSHSNSIAGKIDAISVGTKTNSLLEDILGVVTNIRDNISTGKGKGKGRRGRGSNGPRPTPPNIPPSSGGDSNNTDSIEDQLSISATDAGSLDLASYGIDESKIDKSDPVNKKLITMIKNYSQLISERWDRGRHGNTGSTDAWLHYITQQDKLLRYLKYRTTEAKRYNGKVNVTEDDFNTYTADYMSNQANFDPKFLATIDWSQFSDDEDYRKNIIARAKIYESIRNDNFYGGMFGDQKDYRIQSDLGYLLSGKNKKGENLSEEEKKEMLNKTGAHIENASEQIQEQIKANRIYAKQGLFGGIFGTTGENKDYAQRIEEATGDANLANADIFTQLTNAADMGSKLAVINANIDEIVKAPRTMLTTVIKSADSVMYDFFFGKETEVKDKNGKPIKGLFNRMTFEMGQTMEKLNSSLDDIFSNKDDWLGKLNDTINNWFGIDIKGSYQKGREYIRDKIIEPTKKSIKETAVNTFDEVSDAVTGTVDDIFKTDYTEKNRTRRENARRRAEMSEEERQADILREQQEKEAKQAAEQAAEQTGQAAAGDTGVSGKNFLSKNELLTGNQGIYQIEKSGLYDLGKGKYNVIPGNLNPFISSASRSAYSINANKANEDRLRSNMMNRLQQGDSNLAAKLFPGYAEGTPPSAPKYHEVEEDRSRLLQVISVVAPQLLNDATGGEASELIDMILGYAQAAGKDPFEILLGIIQYSGGMVGDAGRKIGVPDAVKNFFTKELIKTHESDYMQENDEQRYFLEQFMRSAGYQGKFDTKENIRNRKYESRGGVSDRVRQFMDTAFGADPAQAADEARKYVTENTGSILKGGLGGALASAIFPLGGPLMGAIAGASAKLLSNNSSFMNYVFGTATGEEEDVLDKDGNATGRTVAKRKNDGLFGNTFLKTIAKYAPDAKKYGLTGIIAGSITPLGPLGGVMAGLAASWIKNNKTANDFIFGDEGGLLNKDRKAKIKKALPAIGASVLATMFLGPFGLMGNAVLGSALGMLSTTEYFKRMILGSKGKDGSRHGGLAGAIRAQITNPFKKFMEESKKDFRKWWHDEVFRKLARGLPSIGGLIKDVVKGAGKSFVHYLDKTFNVNISGFVEKWMNKGLAGLRQGAKNLVYKPLKFIGKHTIGALASGVQNLGQLADDIRLRSGNIENMTTYDRLEMAAKRGNLRYAGEGIDRWVAGIKNEGAINELAENLEILGRIHDNWGAEQVQRNMQEGYHNTRNILAKFNEMGKFDSGEYGNMLDAIQKLSQLELKNTDDPYGAIKNILDYNHNIKPEEKKEIMEAVEEYYKEGNRNRAVAATFSNSAAMDSVIKNIIKNANAQGATVSIDEQDLMSHAGNWARQLKDEVKLRKEKLERADEKAKSENRIVDDSVLRFDATGTSDVAGGIRRDNETLQWMVRLLTDPKTADSMTANQWAASVGNVIAVFADQDKYTKMMRDQEALRGYHQRRADAKEKKEKERVSAALEILNADETIAGFADNADAQNAVYNVISNGKGDLEQEKNMLVKDLELVKRSHEQGNKAQILDISKILDTDEDGKLMHRVAVLTSMGLSVPAHWYEDLQDLTETAFKCVSKLVGMGFRFTNLEDFKEITDSNEDDYKVTALMELAYTKVAELDGGEKIDMADFKTANEIYRRLSDDEEFRARYITGHYQKGGMQSLVDELSANPNHRQDWTHRSDAFNKGTQVYNHKNRLNYEKVNDAYNKIDNSDVTKITGKAALNPVEEEAKKLALAARNIAGAGLYVPYAAARGVLNHIPGTGSLKLGNEIENGLFNLKTAVAGGADSTFTLDNDYYDKYGYEDTRGYSVERLQNLDEYAKARLGHTIIGNKAVDTSNAVRNAIDDVTGDTENILLPQYTQLMKDLADGKIGKLAFIDAINDIHNAGSHAGGFFGGLKNLGIGLFAGSALSGGKDDDDKKDDKDKDKEEIEDVETGTKAKPLSGGDISKSIMDASGITGSIGVADSKIEIGKDGRETKTVNTQYGEITMVRSSADGDWQVAQTKNNQEIVEKMEEDRVIKRGSYEALKKIAENTEDDDNKLKKGAKAAAGGSLFDMFKDLAKMPGDMLSSLGNALGLLPLLGMLGLSRGKNKAGQIPGRRVSRTGAQGARAGAAGAGAAQTGKLAKLTGLLKGLGNKAGAAALIYLLASTLLDTGNAEASELYETDENGDTILDANGEPIPVSNRSADGMSETYESKGLLGSAWDAITDHPIIAGLGGLWAGSKIFPKVHGAYNYANEGYKQHVANQNANAATAAANAQREQWKDAKAATNKQFFDNRKQIKMLQGAIKNLDPNDPNSSIRAAQYQAQINSLEHQNKSIRNMHKQANRNMRNVTTRPVAQSGGLLTDAWAKVQSKLPSVRMPSIPKTMAANPRMTALLGIGGALAGGLVYSGSNYAQYQGVTKDVKQAVGLEKKYFNGEDFGLTDLTPEEQAQADYMTMKNGDPSIAYNWITNARESNGGKPIHFRSTNDERIHDVKNMVVPDNGGFARAGLGLAATSAIPFIADKLTTRTNGIYQGNTTFRNLKLGALGGGLKTLVDAYYGDIDSVGDAALDLGKNVGIATAFNYGIDKAWNKAARNLNAPKVAYENAMAKLAETNKTVNTLQAQVAKDPYNQGLRNQLREAMTNQSKLQLAVDSGFNRATSAAGKAASTAGKVASEAKALNAKMPLGMMLGLAGVNYLMGDAEASAGDMNKPGTSIPEADQSVLSSTLSAIHGMVMNPKHSIAGMIRGNIADSQAHGADMSAGEMAGNAAFTAGAGAVMNSAGHLISGIGNSGLVQAVKGGVNAARSGGNFFTGAGDGWSSGKFSLKDVGKNIKADYKDTFNTAKYIVKGHTTDHALLAEEQVVRTKIRDAFTKFANSIKSFIPSERLANAVQGFGELVFKKLENRSVMKRVLAAISKSMAGSIPVLGWALTAGMGVMEAYAGWNNAEAILKIPRGSATDAMKLMCAVISGATALPFFGIALAVLMSNVVELTIDSGLFCSRKEIEALRKQADPKYESKEYETKATASETQSKAAVQATTGPIGDQNREVGKYKNKNIKDLTKEDLDKTAPKSSDFSEKVYQGLKSAFNTVTDAASSAWDTIKETGSSIYKKITGKGKYGRNKYGRNRFSDMGLDELQHSYNSMINRKGTVLGTFNTVDFQNDDLGVIRDKLTAIHKNNKANWFNNSISEPSVAANTISKNYNFDTMNAGELRAAYNDLINRPGTSLPTFNTVDWNNDSLDVIRSKIKTIAKSAPQQASGSLAQAQRKIDNTHVDTYSLFTNANIPDYNLDDPNDSLSVRKANIFGSGKYGRNNDIPLYNQDSPDDDLGVLRAKAQARAMAMMTGQAMQDDPSIANISMNIAGDTEKQTAADSACGPVSAFNLISSYNQDSPDDDLTVLKAKKQARMKEMIRQSLQYKAINDGIRPEGLKNIIETNSNLKSFVTTNKSTMMDNISTPGSKAIFMGGGASAFGNGVSSNDDLDYYSDQGQHYVEVENVGNNIAAIKDPQDGLMFDSIDNVVNRSNTGVMVNGEGKYGRMHPVGKYGRVKIKPVSKYSDSILHGIGMAAAKGRSKLYNHYSAKGKYGRKKGGSLDGVTEKDVLNEMLYVAAGIAKKIGSKHPELFFGQMIMETGGPDKYISANKKVNAGHDHNYGGFTWYKGMGEEYRGVPRPEGGYYATFDSADEYIEMLYNKVYKSYANEMAKVETPEEFAQTIKKHGYFADDNVQGYANGIRDGINRYANELKNIGNIDLSKINAGSSNGNDNKGKTNDLNSFFGFLGAIADKLNIFSTGNTNSNNSSPSNANIKTNGGVGLDNVIKTNLQFTQELPKRSSTNRIIIHHTGDDDMDVDAQTIHQWHLKNGWAGIGYHLVVRKNGTVEEGRPLDTIGSHAQYANSDSVGIHICGGFNSVEPTPEQLGSLVRLIQDLSKMYNIPIDRKHIIGHKEVCDTTCPGTNLYNKLEDICNKAASSTPTDTNKDTKEETKPEDKKDTGKGKSILNSLFGRAKIDLENNKGKEFSSPDSEGTGPDPAVTKEETGKLSSPIGKYFGRAKNSNAIVDMNSLKEFDNPFTADTKQTTKTSLGITPSLKKHSKILGKGKFGRFKSFGRVKNSNAIVDMNSLKTFDNPFTADIKQATETSLGITPSLKKHSKILGKGKFGRSKSFGRGTEIPQLVWNYFEPKYGPVATAAIMGNIWQESRFDPTAVNELGCSGLAQWYQERNDNMRAYARSKGVDWTDPQAQIEYLESEIQANKRYQDALAQMKDMTPEDAAAKWEEVFEVSGGSALSERKKAARAAFDKKGAIDGADVNVSISSPSSSSGPAGGIFGALFGKVSSMIDKMKAPVTAGLKAFGGAFSNLLGNSPFGKMATLLFGANNPLSNLANMFSGKSSSPGGSSGGPGSNPSTNPISTDCPTEGSCGNALKTMLKCEITSPYGPRFGGSDFHDGIDYGIGTGTDVPSTCDGIVDDVNKTDEYGSGYGYYVVIKDNEGHYHMYAHNSQPLVDKGQTVTAGQIIAKSGYSGHCSPSGPDGAHLHYGIHPDASCKKGTGSDPMKVPLPVKSAKGKFGRAKLKMISIKPKKYFGGTDAGLIYTPDNASEAKKFEEKFENSPLGIASLNFNNIDNLPADKLKETYETLINRPGVSVDTFNTVDWENDSNTVIKAKIKAISKNNNFGMGKYGRGELTPLQQKLLQRRYEQIRARIGKPGLQQTLMPSGMNFDNFGIPFVPQQAKLETKVTNKSRLHENEILDILTNKKSYKNKTKFNLGMFDTNTDTKVFNGTEPIFGGMFDSFKNVFNTTKMSDKQTETPDIKQPETKVTNRTEYDFDNMSFEEMKQAYSTLDLDSVTNKDNIPDWDNDAINVIRAKMKSLFKNTNNKLNTEQGNKAKENKQSYSILDGIKKFGTNIKDIAKSALTTDIDFKNKIKNTDKKLQNKIVDVIDRTTNEKVDFSKLPKAPNGKEYTKNDVEYLLNNGYSLKDALDLLSKDKKYTEKDDETKKKEDKDTNKYENLKDIDLTKIPKAPNGKEYTKNDISYLIGKGYTLENAIKLLSEHEKYAKKEDKKTTSTGAVDNKTATQSKTVESTSDEISLKILEATNKTNELLSALLQAVTGNYEKQQQAAEATVKQNKTQHKIDKLNEAKNTINMILSPSGVGLGREFSGASQSSGATKIIPALNAMATM